MLAEIAIKYWVEFAFGIVVALLGGLYKKLSKQFKQEQEKRKSVEAGLQALLRDRIVQAYNEYVIDKKPCPIYGKENVNAMYDAYHSLGGNGTITTLVDQINSLPTSTS